MNKKPLYLKQILNFINKCPKLVKESKIINFTQTYIEDLKTAAAQKDKAGGDGGYLEDEANAIQSSLNKYIDRTQRANKLIEHRLSNIK